VKPLIHWHPFKKWPLVSFPAYRQSRSVSISCYAFLAKGCRLAFQWQDHHLISDHHQLSPSLTAPVKRTHAHPLSSLVLDSPHVSPKLLLTWRLLTCCLSPHLRSPVFISCSPVSSSVSSSKYRVFVLQGKKGKCLLYIHQWLKTCVWQLTCLLFSFCIINTNMFIHLHVHSAVLNKACL